MEEREKPLNVMKRDKDCVCACERWWWWVDIGLNSRERAKEGKSHD